LPTLGIGAGGFMILKVYSIKIAKILLHDERSSFPSIEQQLKNQLKINIMEVHGHKVSLVIFQ
jgi:hypothetical protein